MTDLRSSESRPVLLQPLQLDPSEAPTLTPPVAAANLPVPYVNVELVRHSGQDLNAVLLQRAGTHASLVDTVSSNSSRALAIKENPNTHVGWRLALPTVGGALLTGGAIALNVVAAPVVALAAGALVVTGVASELGFRLTRKNKLATASKQIENKAADETRAKLTRERDSAHDPATPRDKVAGMVATAEAHLASLWSKDTSRALAPYKSVLEEIVAAGETVPSAMLDTARRMVRVDSAMMTFTSELRRYSEDDGMEALDQLNQALDALPKNELEACAESLRKRIFGSTELVNGVEHEELYSEIAELYARLSDAAPAYQPQVHEVPAPAAGPSIARFAEELLAFDDALANASGNYQVDPAPVERAVSRATSSWTTPLERAAFADSAERHLAWWDEQSLPHFRAAISLRQVIEQASACTDAERQLATTIHDVLDGLLRLDSKYSSLKQVHDVLTRYEALGPSEQVGIATLVIDRLFAKPGENFPGAAEVFRVLRRAKDAR